LRLTVALLALSVLLVFFGTLAQVDQGLWRAQEVWFRSLLVHGQKLRLFNWHFMVPIFPGGYLIGYTLLANLTGAFIKRFEWRREKIGIHLVHSGVILLLLGQLLTDLLSHESHLQLKEGQTKNYSEAHRRNELVFARDATPGQEEVVAIRKRC
jgi:cytochrome c biogenesis factor